jgi:hypothetical protein
MVKSKTAAPDVPELVTEADEPGAPVVVVPAAIVAAVPGLPVAPVAPVLPVSPLSPRGIVKSKTAAEEVPVLVTLADDPGAPVVVVPAAMVAALPAGPWLPVAPVAPVWPAGMPKLKTAAEDVPALATVAEEPGARVEVVPTAIVAASP